MVTYWDMQKTGKAESWRRIRALRAQPPTLVTHDRRLVFSAALEQAEQQFLAARAVGVQSRPLNLFYGLSQAGRAVSAALTAPGEDFQLKGHGIGCPGADAAMATDPVGGFLGLNVRAKATEKNESFPRVSALLRSPTLDPAVTLGQLLRMLVEPEMHEPFGEDGLAVKHLTVHKHNQDMLLVAISGLDTSYTVDSYARIEREYPSLAGMEINHVSEPPQPDKRGRERVSVTLLNRSSSDPSSVGIDYRGDPVAMPAVGDPRGSMHPLMVWWGVLYSLSTLARYHPAAWTAITDVDTSPHAVPLEYLLTVAQESVPDMLWRTLAGDA